MSMKKFVDTLRLFINRRVGYDIVYFSGQHTLRAHLVKVFKEYEIDAIIDVGANEGQFALAVRSLGFSGKIYSFEPVDEAFEKLAAASSSDGNWFVFNFALGSESGESLINVSDFTSFSSILNPSDYALERWENSRVDHKQKITIRTLDECKMEGLIPESNIFLKMDTQGYDLEVFKGADSILLNVRGVLSELSLIAVYNDMPGYKQSLSTFEEAGFSVSGLYPITRNKDLSLNEVDCVLVNTVRHGKARN